MNLHTLEACASHLNAGGLLVYPTETFCAIGCRMDCPAAIEAIFAIKKRPFVKPLPLIVGHLGQAAAMADLSQAPAYWLQEIWPGPLALVLPAIISLAPGLINPQNKICLRLPGSPFAASLAAAAGPLIATSANLSGCQPAKSARSISAAFWSALDGSGASWAVYGGEGEGQFSEPSAIVEPTRLAYGWKARLLRQGCASQDWLAQKLSANVIWEIP